MKLSSLVLSITTGIALILGLASALPSAAADAQVSQTEAYSQGDVTAEREAPDPSVTPTARQQRKALLNARREARREERRQAATQNQAVPGATSLPVASPADITVSFKVDPRLTRGLYMGDRWVSPPTYSGVKQGVFTVEARVQGRDAKGQPVAFNPKWMPSDPSVVSVSPGQGTAVTITVHRAGESRLRVAVDDESQGLIVFKELPIKAWYQGTAIQVEIDTTRAAVKGSAQQEQQGRPVVRDGWRFVDGGPAPASQEQSRPILRNGWKFVD